MQQNRFNPRARAGRDWPRLSIGARHNVSIHAPARGATGKTQPVKIEFYSFNPRARAGRDIMDSQFLAGIKFQSTRPRGARRSRRRDR